MSHTEKTSIATLMPRLKIPTAEQLAVETLPSTLFRETLEALDAGTPPRVVARAMYCAGLTEEEVDPIVREAILQLPIARHNAAAHLESDRDPDWYAAKKCRVCGWTTLAFGALGGIAAGAFLQTGMPLPKAVLVLGEHTWTIGALAAIFGIMLAIHGHCAMKRVRRTALTKRI